MKILAVALILIAAVGCSHQEFNRPSYSWVGDWFDSGEPYLLPGKSPAAMRSERLAAVLAARKDAPKSPPGDYRIGARDMLELSIFALESPETTSRLQRTVARGGQITLPWVGQVIAAGLTTRQLEDQIKAAYAGRYLKDPQVTVSVTEYQSNFVVITGAVRNPGIYYLSSNSTTLLTLLGRAGGITDDATDHLQVVRAMSVPGADPPAIGRQEPADAKKNQVIPVDLRQLVDDGNLLFNVDLVSGDLVSVSARAKDYVFVLGHVGSPGAVPVRDGRIDVLGAIARAGGLTAMARANNSVVVREQGDLQPAEIVDVDLTKIARGVRPPLYLHPGDTLIVGSDLIARLANFVRPSAGASASMATTGVP